MRLERDKIYFVLSHLVFLVSLIVISQIPRSYPVILERFLPPTDRMLRFYIIGALSVVFLAYYMCGYFYRRANISFFKMDGLSVYFWTSTAVVFLILCGSYALLSHDLYEYSIRGRMLSVYKLNPYLHTPIEIKSDMFFPMIFWKTTPECYAPLWILIGALHTLFFKSSISLTVFMHKFILLVFLGLSASIFYKLAKEIMPRNAEPATMAFLFNPLVIVMTLMDGHNEIAMTFFILCAFYLLIRSKYVSSFVFLALATAVKFVYLIFIPIFILYILFSREAEDIKGKVYRMSAGIAAFICVTVITWLPFGWESVKAIYKYYHDLSMNFWFDSIPYAVYFVLDRLGAAVSKNLVADLFSLLFVIIYSCALGYFAKKAKADRRAIFTTSALILLALLFTNSTPFQPWYLIWVIPLIFLSSIRLKYMLVFLLSYFLIMTFWKRMCVLVFPMIAVYSLMLFSIKASRRR